MSNKGFLKRLDQLARSVNVKRARQIVVLVDGNNEDQSAAGAIVQELAPGPRDLVIYLARFGGKDPNLPRLGSITPI